MLFGGGDTSWTVGGAEGLPGEIIDGRGRRRMRRVMFHDFSSESSLGNLVK